MADEITSPLQHQEQPVNVEEARDTASVHELDHSNDVEKSKEDGDIQAVTWKSDSDPENPLNWSKGRKWGNVLVISLQAMLSPLSSTVLAIGAMEVAKAFHLTSVYSPALPVGLYVLGLGLGPLFLAPCSELYGRRVVYVLSFIAFTAFTLGSAWSPNFPTLCILRVLSGVAGSAGPSIGASSMGDLFIKEERGAAQAVYSLGPTFGPVLGGVIGGFIIHYTGGWKWLIWSVACASGVINILSILFLRESYGPYILSQKAKILDKENPNIAFRTEPRVHAKELFVRSISRPLRLLFTSPICAFMSMYLGLVYGILYLFMIVLPILFATKSEYNLYTYEWTHGTTGLSYLSAGLGALIGSGTCFLIMNRSFAYELRKQEQRTGDTTKNPELRLPFMQVGMCICPLGLIMFAWSAGKVHWAVPLLGAMLYGIGMIMTYVCIHTYLVDCFSEWAASAIAAAVLTRCVITCVLCVVGFQLYSKLNYDWGSMLLAFICLSMVPIPYIIKIYGPKMRERKIAD